MLFVVDVSGSMSWRAYNYGGLAYTGAEEGYFTPASVYQYNSTSPGYWEQTTGTTVACPSSSSSVSTSSRYTGSCLNYLYMDRIDLVRWAITGGTPNSCTGTKTFNNNECDPELWANSGNSTKVGSVCNDTIGGCIMRTSDGTKVKVPWARVNDSLSLRFKGLKPQPRMGAYFFSGDGVRSEQVYVGDFTAPNSTAADNPYMNLITHINSSAPSGATPTGPALWDALNYYRQTDPEYGGIPAQQGSGDRWKNPLYVCDGGGSNCVLVPCAKNFVVLLSDGQWNIGGEPAPGGACSIDDGYENYSADPVVPAYKMHMGFTNTKAGDSGTATNVTAVYSIGLFLSGSGELALQNVAMYGSFDKSSKTWPDSKTGYPSGTCTMADCGSGKGSGCTALPASSSDWDADSNNSPDTFYSATNAIGIKDVIMKAITDILRRASSGTTVVSLPPTQSRESYVLAQSYFYPEKQSGDFTIKWTGYLRLLWADVVGNIRENTDSTGESSVLKIFDTIKDKIMAFVFSTTDQKYVGKIFSDSDGDATPDSCSSTQKNSEDILHVWEAGAILKAKSPADRNIKTWVDSDSDGVVDTGEYVDFDTGLNTSLNAYWSYASNDLGTCDANCAESVIKYIRGYDRPSPSGSGFRLRQTDDTSGSNITTAWKLGDVIFSTPRITSNKAVNGYDTRYKDATYSAFVKSDRIKNTAPLAIMGANDGMLHAFTVGKLEDINPPTTSGGGKQTGQLTSPSGATLGDEAWAFIPRNVMPYLRWYCDSTYCHIPMADTTFTIVDASIGGSGATAGGTRTADSWRRLLVGAMGFGGTPITFGTGGSAVTFSSSLFVLDITPNSDGSIPTPTLLWEKRLPDNTLTTGTPGIVRLGSDTTNGSWYVVVGSGPTSLSTNSVTYPSSPKIYGYNLKDGSEVSGGGIAVTGASNVAVGDFSATDMDNDYQTDGLYFGTYGGTGSGQTGKLYRLRIRNGASTYQTTPASWAVSLAVDAGRPVFASPAMTTDSANNIWVYFGTGLYLTTEHITSSNELFYGFKETEICWKGYGTGTCPAGGYTSFLDTTNAAFSGGKASKIACQCDGGIVLSTSDCVPAGTCTSCSSSTMIVTGTTGVSLSGSGVSCSAQDPASCDSKTDQTAVDCVACAMNSYGGWKVTVSNAKMYASPLVAGGIVSTTLFTPTTDVCQFGGTSSIMSLNYNTGSTYYQPAIQTQGGTTGTAASLGISKIVQVGIGAPPFKQSLVPIATGSTYKVFTQASGGIAGININPSVPYMANGFIQWLSK